MRFSQDWKDYELIATSDGEKLERWGKNVLIRPDPQVLWSVEKDDIWKKANAHYFRSKEGGGHWRKGILRRRNG